MDPHPIRAIIAMRSGVTLASLHRRLDPPVSYNWLCECTAGEGVPSYDLAQRVADLVGLPIGVCWDLSRVGAPRAEAASGEVRQ